MEIIQKNWTLNDSLSLIERVVLHNLKLYESFEDKVIYFEKYYSNLIKKVFNNKKYIVETYNKKFTRNLIMESNFDFQNEIKKTHNFIKKSIKFDTLLEQTQTTTNTQQVNKTYDTKTASIESPRIASGDTTVKNPAEIVKDEGWENFIKTLRDMLSSQTAEVITFVTDLWPATKVASWAAWAVVALYDAHMVFKGHANMIPSLIGDLLSLLMKLNPVPVRMSVGLRQFIANPLSVVVVKRAQGTILENILKFLSTEKYLPWFYKILGGLNKVASKLKDAIAWAENYFNSKLTWLRDAIQGMVNYVDGIRSTILKLYPDINAESELKLDTSQKKQGVGGITRDTSTPVVNPNFKFNPPKNKT
jgi:hypothetical protein